MTPHSSFMLGVRLGFLIWKTGCLVSRCSGEPVFPAPSPLPTAPGVVVFLSLSCFSPCLFSQFPVLGWRVGSQTFRELHTQAKCEGSSSVPVAPPKREARIYESVPAGSLPKYHLISFRCSLVLLFVPVSAVHDFRRSSHPHAHARHLGFAHARA